MHDFAACVLASLESWMLTASPAMISLSTLTDTSEFTGVAIPPYSAEDDAGRTKRKYARLQKSMGDYSLLAGSPLDAVDHYNTAVELGRAGLDFTIAAAAIEGYAAAKLLHAAVSNDAFVMNAASVFRDESAWRSPRNSIGITNSSDAVTEGEIERKRTSSSSMTSARSPVESVPPRTPGEETASGEVTSTTTSLKEELRTTSSIPSSGSIENVKEIENCATSAVSYPPSSQVTEQVFDGLQFWDALRRSTGLEEEIRGLVEEAKGFIRKRGGLPLLVEADLRWARLLAGLHGCNARSEATELANEVQLVAEMLPLPEDRLIALTESAGILGTVGAGRKRVLLMWQAVELSKYFGFPDARTLAVARSALEPATRHDQEYPLMLSSRGNNNCGEIAAASFSRNISSSRYSGVVNDDWDLSRQRPLDQETTIPASWAPVRAGCLEATLGLAIYAKRHSDVFDAAAALLRDHSIELSTHRMQSLLDNLVAAASQMAISEKARPGKGPPPLLYVVGPRAVPDALAPLWIQPLGNDEGNNNTKSTLTNSMGSGNFAAQSPSSRQNVFLYDPFSAKRQKERNELRKKKGFASMDGLNSGGVAGIASGAAGGVEALLGEIDSGIQWVSGEPAMVDIEVANPSSVSIKIDKMVLEAKFIPLASNSTSTSDDSSHTAAGNSELPPLPTSSSPQTSILPVTATKSIWKGKPVSLNIPAYTKPVRIQLEGTPLVPGILILTGCRLTAFGGVSWSQPWTGKPLNLAKILAEASSKKLFLGKEGISVAKSDSGGSSGDQALAADTLATDHAVVEAMIPMKGPAVTILPTLPRLKLELHSASAAAAAADGLSGGAAGTYKEHEAMSSKVPNRSSSSPITLLKLMHGQSVMPHLVITNNGAVAIDTLRIGIGDVNTTAADLHNNKYGGSSKPVSVDVDTSTLKSLLPLQPGQSISLPVLCRALGGRINPSADAGAPVRSGGGGEMPTSALAEQQQQPWVETIDVEYATSSTQTPGSSSAAPFNSPTMSATTEVPGRRAMLEIAIAAAPSLHVSQIEFAEVYQQQQQQLETHNNQGCTTSCCERRALMLADVVNRGSTVLEAWLGPSSSSSSTHSTNSSNGGTGNDNIETEKKNQNHVVVLAPGQRAALSYLVNKEDVAPLIATTAADGRDDLDWNTYVLNNAKLRNGRNSVVLRYEEREKQMCASFLAERIGLHFNTYVEKTKSSNSGGGNGGGDGIEEQSSTAVIDDSTTIVSGSLPLLHGEIYNGITPSVLCMLRSCAISLRFSIAPLDVEPGEQNAIATTTEETDDSTTSVTIPTANTTTNLTDPVPLGNLLSFSNSNSSFTSETDSGSLLVLPSALRASLGQPLKVTMEVESNVDEAVEVFCSFMCTPVPTPVVPPVGAVGTMNSAGGGGGGGGASGVVDPSPRDAVGGGVDSSLSLNSLGGVYSPAPVAAGVGLGVGGLNGTATAGLPAAAAAAATWVGIHSRLQISVPARKKITHVAGVTIVAPGRYRVGTGHVSVTYPEALSTEVDGGGGGGACKNTLVSIAPCFLSVE